MKRAMILFSLGVLTAAAIPADAQAGADVETISLAGQVVMRIREDAGGYTAAQRADAIRSRLVDILSLENLKAEDVVVRRGRGGQEATIYVRDLLLITVVPSMARSNQTTPVLLAQGWAKTLRTLLPQVAVKPPAR